VGTLPAVNRFVRFFPFSCFGLALVLFLAACGPTGGGGGSVSGSVLSRKIEFAPRYNIEKAVMFVFQGDGFQPLPGSGVGGKFAFLRKGGGVGQERFGEWFGPGVFLRAEVDVTEVEFGTHRVRCTLLADRGDGFIPTSQGDRRGKVLLKRVKQLTDVL